MIDFQSPTTVERQNHRPFHSPSPWGEGRGEGGPFEIAFCIYSDEGELNHRGRQSAPLLCSPGTFENSQQHARVIYGWVHLPQPTQSPAGKAEIRVHQPGHRSLGEGGYPSVIKFAPLAPKILKPAQGCPNLSNPVQGSWEGRGVSINRERVYKRLVPSICAYHRFFSGKKDCLFFQSAALELRARWRESIQINPSRFKYKLRTGRYRPKTNRPLAQFAIAALPFPATIEKGCGGKPA